jgi:regulator of protease activity HflC (stomatin/prohibitin superfamily)
VIRERERAAISGFLMSAVLLAALVLLIWALIRASRAEDALAITLSSLGLAVVVFLLTGLFIVNPNEGKVLQLFGRYVGTVKSAGLRWANPLYTKRRISLRVRNFESGHLKVNDHDGNPIEIAAVVVWRVVDSAEALFQVDDYQNYPYDIHDEGMSLRGNTLEVADHLKREVQDRLARAGVEVLESRISHLAYAPEIAQAMLQRQQAGAIIAARQRIVEGAVGMVEMALEMLSQRDILELDNERKAAMVSNLLVVLCGERATQPIVNTGTIYQ